MSFVDETEHSDALRETGFWGRQGAGCIIVARSTGRIQLPLRSDAVLEPGTWGVWGGAIDPGSDITESVKREVVEETGYEGDIELYPLCVFEDAPTGFRYHNFIGVVDDEFEAKLNWESEDSRWFTEGDWPEPLHFGLRYLLDQCPHPTSSIPSGPSL